MASRKTPPGSTRNVLALRLWTCDVESHSAPSPTCWTRTHSRSLAGFSTRTCPACARPRTACRGRHPRANGTLALALPRTDCAVGSTDPPSPQARARRCVPRGPRRAAGRRSSTRRIDDSAAGSPPRRASNRRAAESQQAARTQRTRPAGHCRRGAWLFREVHLRCLRRFGPLQLEVLARAFPDRLRRQDLREAADVGVVAVHRVVVVLARHGDAVLRALELVLKRAEVLVGLELGVVLRDREQAPQGRRERRVGRSHLLQIA